MGISNVRFSYYTGAPQTGTDFRVAEWRVAVLFYFDSLGGIPTRHSLTRATSTTNLSFLPSVLPSRRILPLSKTKYCGVTDRLICWYRKRRALLYRQKKFFVNCNRNAPSFLLVNRLGFPLIQPSYVNSERMVPVGLDLSAY